MNHKNKDQSMFFLERVECPKCGSKLISNGKSVWCSYIGSYLDPSCDFGCLETVPISSIYITDKDK
jgi:hypothetical protein